MKSKLQALLSRKPLYSIGWVDVFFLAILTVVFFALPVFLAPDSLVYINNTYVLEGRLPWADWNSMRGPALPFFLWLSFGFFGESAYGTAVGFYLLYLLYLVFCLYFAHLLGIKSQIGKLGTWLACTFLLFLNPTVLSYSHHVLTEFAALVLTVAASALILKTHQLLYTHYSGQGAASSKAIWAIRAARYLGCAFLLILSYATKQMFFIYVLAPLLISEVLLLISRFSLRRLLLSIVALLLVAFSLPVWSSSWDRFVSGNARVQENFTAQNLAQSTLIDGLRYFRPTQRGTIGVPVEIEVMDNSFTQASQTFTYTFSGSFTDSLHYLTTCFFKSPERFITSWVHNYFVISNVRRVMDYGESRAHIPVSQTNHFFLSFENEAWLERFKSLEQGSTGYHPDMPSGNPQFEQPVDSGLVSNLIFNTFYPRFSYFLYSFPAFCALPLFITGVIGSIYAARKKLAPTLWHMLTLLSGSIFISILFLAVTACNIDRYGFPASLWCALLLFGLLFHSLRCLLGRLRALKKNP